MVGRTLSHYTVLERLGAGAMGDVYLAEDQRLGRRVALKLLAPPLVRDEAAKARLIREARAASRLEHPAICPVHDIEELPGGQLVLVMAWCDGETLKARLARGPLPVAEALDLVCQVAEGLAEAHAHGIVHRDLKPANLIVSRGGRVRIVDFGLAQVPEASSLTTSGTTLGTPAYMSPEQARGEDVDARTDLWALGAVLYEMLAGRPPFGGSAHAVLYGIINQIPEPLDRIRPGLPPSLSRVVNRALAKDRLARYQQAEPMLADLRACRERLSGDVPAAPVSPRLPSVAVLPFANLSPEKEQEYFCEGMTEELITALGSIEGLRVAAKTSSFHVHGRDLELREIGDQLNVETLLEGSVRKAGDRLRVTAQLVNVADGYHLWSERFDRRLDDVFAVQDEIARAIVEKLRVKLVRTPGAPLVKRASTSLEAYQLYLKGRYSYARRYKGGIEQARECFTRAIALDPRYAPALAGLADACSVQGFYGLSPVRGLLQEAQDAARRAVDLDDSLAEAHHALGLVHVMLGWDGEVAVREFTRALALDPHAPLTHGYYGLALSIVGRAGEAIREAEQAIALDPLSALAFNIAAASHYVLRRFEPSIELNRKAFALDPGFLPSSWMQSLALSEIGRHEEALEAGKRGVEMSGGMPFFLAVHGRALGRAGRGAAARSVLAELLQRSRSGEVGPLALALIHDGLGEVEAGIAALERHVAESGGASVLLLCGPSFTALWGDPRYAAMLHGLGYDGPWAGPGRGTRVEATA